MSLSYELVSLIKEGALFARLTHEETARIAGEKAEFQPNEIDILVEHSNDPDKYDWFFDRFWKHFYDVGIGFGGAPQSCEITYMRAVNHNDLIRLSSASHYLMDIGSVFHTTFSGQEYHLWYEQWLDDNLIEIFNLIDVDSLVPIQITNISSSVIGLARETNQHFNIIMNLIINQDYENLKIVSADILKNVIEYNWGLYNKFIEDITNGVFYDVPIEAGMNQLLIAGMLVGLLLYIYQRKKNKAIG